MKTKIALITGGSRGLGRSMALHLAQKGVDLVITYRSKQAEAGEVVEAAKKLGRKAVALRLDMGTSLSFAEFAVALKAQLASVWGAEQIDFLVNNAGLGAFALFEKTTEEQFDEMISVHVKGPFFLTQKLLPLMKNGGRILNVSSGLARFALPGYSAYGSAKGAIEVFTRYLAKELGPRGISVNAIAPGAIETDFGGGMVRDNAEMNKMVASHTAMGRVGLPDDIGGAVAAILIGDIQWMTGQRIEISGGQNI